MQGPPTSSGSWLASLPVRWRWVLGAVLFWGGALCGLLRSTVGDQLTARLARPLDFYARASLGRSPIISEQLKIFSVDDSTFAQLGSWVLTIDQWAKILHTVAANKPRAIFIDAMFSKVDDPEHKLSVALKTLKSIDVPIIVGSYVTEKAIRYRETLTVDKVESMYSKSPMAWPSALARYREDEWLAYGPNSTLQPAFAHVGHFLYAGAGRIAPFIPLSNERVLPHVSMFLAKDQQFMPTGVNLDGRLVPLDRDGMLTVNFAPPAAYQAHNYSMKGLLQLAMQGEKSRLVQADDVVLIIPHMYTGNTDFKQTPFGYAPGGFVIAAMLNSLITGEWLKPLVGEELIILLAVMAGAALGMQGTALNFWVWLLGGASFLLAANVYVFSWHGILVSWLLVLSGFIGAALTVFAEKTRINEKKSRALRLALEGAVAPHDLKAALKNPQAINLDARERVVTLMFVDVAGFSLLAENMQPRLAFDSLKLLLTLISETVHGYGGVIDKTLGDGLLCYFGYRFDQDRTSPDHAEQALQCAIKIQQDNMQRNIEAIARGELVYPLRIGINTASCYLGDLGSGERIDFTVVGNGVNFAKRLEGACDLHSILVGATSYDLAQASKTGNAFTGDRKTDTATAASITRRLIRIKHHAELVEAYEYDPFHKQPELRQAATEGFRRCISVERLDQRWPVHDAAKIQLHCEFGAAVLMNFSHSGLSVRLKQFLAKGTHLSLSLDDAQGDLKRRLAEQGIEQLQAEVRWGYAEAGGYVHGLLVTNLSDRQSDYLVQCLCDLTFIKQATRSA